MGYSSRNVSVALFALIGFLLIGHNNFGADAEKEIPMTKFGQNGPTISFLYCYSCGYRKAYEDYSVIIAEKYPQMTVQGANYDFPGFNMYLSKVIFFLKIVLIVIIVSAFDIFGAFGQPTPGWWKHLIDNKLYACMMIFFVGNMLEANMVSSGAFEISLNDVPVWSKLQTGRIPAPQELFQIIDSQLQFSDKIQENPDFVK
ncbi:thioredoxin reductase-like selenoprotein T homolog CG3887 [Eupeodes corollae]|uniref:thioredoxin reductase-like selenoprotein T homolog CG3887 n=1 Tax=Eupeodes corollae TaxID=290404 RepID=UPI00249067AE|nr:thioredoxin reductase-like selenoprotein T homolog CG3887 [Eupeodes corollae]